MNSPKLNCEDDKRRLQVRERKVAGKPLNGLDYLDVAEDQVTLTLYFLGKAPPDITANNIRIEGGRRVRGIRVINTRVCRAKDQEQDDCIKVTLDKPGDFSSYTLRLVEARGDRPGDVSLGFDQGFDPRYTQLDFSFKVNCPSDLDCLPDASCPPEPLNEPEISYLAKDYASFRQVILDRLALVMPEWRERHVPDIGITLVELFAYVGDYLSYYQDAVATEAYLDTARQRISVRRHARLIDYRMHEGCNARAWVVVETQADRALNLNVDPFYFVTGRNNALPAESRVLQAAGLKDIQAGQYEVYEPLWPKPRTNLYRAHNEIRFWTWGDQECCLPRGATSATLVDEWEALPSEAEEQYEPPQYARQAQPSTRQTRQAQQAQVDYKTPPAYEQPERQRRLKLKPGDVLILEEVLGPETGNPADADPRHRHAVCLTRVELNVDELYDQPVVEIEWAQEEALPFPLCISSVTQSPCCDYLENVSVARGNVLLVDHGRTIDLEDLGSVPVIERAGECRDDCWPPDVTEVAGRYRPRLRETPLTFSQPLTPGCPASRLVRQDPRSGMPQVRLEERGRGANGSNGPEVQWSAIYDLLASSGADCNFVAEMDNEGYAHLRFGDGELGCAPRAGSAFAATYRVGNGIKGNVGAEAISHIVFRNPVSGEELRARNPLPATGGVEPEPISEVKMFAPATFRRRLQRAVTAGDYATLVDEKQPDGTPMLPGVQKAAASLRWTGSWYEVQVAVDRTGQTEAAAPLLKKVNDYLYSFRRIGHELRVLPARYVPLDIELVVCVLPEYLRGHVKAALLQRFSNRTGRDGKRGFFHPDNLTFGTSIHLSELVALAQSVPGVESVQVKKLQRQFEGPDGEIENGVLPVGPLEIAQLDNDPSFPELGTLKLEVRGGR
ncbi:MAG TPA: putative baseplate assembly protein [Chloroflexia bacterium]|jgi:hypothetical protein